ncbi:unnamed protein product [Ambrosiozyma monospora]|uniref:Unnamed protein product n=1 Tax=Ambrosiozyma monospora TaxID=43982 RepID=A0ACB5TV25_AMBMO|nr:unnamed protein product [Ambrosiozyma monospora]
MAKLAAQARLRGGGSSPSVNDGEVDWSFVNSDDINIPGSRNSAMSTDSASTTGLSGTAGGFDGAFSDGANAANVASHRFSTASAYASNFSLANSDSSSHGKNSNGKRSANNSYNYSRRASTGFTTHTQTGNTNKQTNPFMSQLEDTPPSTSTGQKYRELRNTTFETIVHILDLVVARQPTYTYLFEMFMLELLQRQVVHSTNLNLANELHSARLAREKLKHQSTLSNKRRSASGSSASGNTSHGGLRGLHSMNLLSGTGRASVRSFSAPSTPIFGDFGLSGNKTTSNSNSTTDESNTTSSSTGAFGTPPTTDFSSDSFNFVGSAPSGSSKIGGSTSSGSNGGVDPLYRRQSILSPSSAMESDSAPPLLPQVAVYLVDDLNHHLGSFSTAWNSIGRAICRVSVLVLRIAVASDASHQVGFSIAGSSNASANSRRRSTSGTIAGGATEISRALNRFQHNVGEFLKCDSGSLVSDQLVVIPQLELMLECFQNHFDDYQLATIVTFWCNCIGDKGLGVMPDPDRKKQHKRRDQNGEYEDEEKEDMNPLVLKKKGLLHRLVLSKLLFVNRSVHSFLIDTKMPKAREELYRLYWI